MNYTPPVEIAAFLACVLFLVALANQVATLWYRIKGKPTPAEMASASATLSERIGRIETCMGACQSDHGRRLSNLESHQENARKLIADEVDKVFNRVNNVADECANIRGELTGINRQLERLGK
jgi:hypothetical protein